MLVTEPVVFFFSLWVSFSWAVLYLQFGSVPLIFEKNHGFNIEQVGATFTCMSLFLYLYIPVQSLTKLIPTAMCVGALLITVISIYQEKIASRFNLLPNTPEARLYFVCIESILMPIGLFWFGWTSYSHIHWISPTIAIGCATMGIFSVYLAVFNYLADTYHRYASSAIAAQSCCRNLLGGVFPLVTNAMFNNLGFPEASSLLGAIGAALCVVPWVLALYGQTIRGKSKLASELAK